MLHCGMTKAVICDLDGLLSDTERLHMGAYQEVLATLGVNLSRDEYIEHWVRNGEGIATYVERNQLPLVAAEVRATKAARYRQMIRTEAEAMPEALPFLRRIQGQKKLALGSSSIRGDVDVVLERIAARDFFEVVVSANDVEKLKPAPDIFLRASELLGVEPCHCVVVEDAQKGVEAAYSAGMKCIAVPNEFTLNDDFSRATAVVPSLAEITVEFIDSLK